MASLHHSFDNNNISRAEKTDTALMKIFEHDIMNFSVRNKNNKILKIGNDDDYDKLINFINIMQSQFTSIFSIYHNRDKSNTLKLKEYKFQDHNFMYYATEFYRLDGIYQFLQNIETHDKEKEEKEKQRIKEDREYIREFIKKNPEWTLQKIIPPKPPAPPAPIIEHPRIT